MFAVGTAVQSRVTQVPTLEILEMASSALADAVESSVAVPLAGMVTRPAGA